MRKNKMSFAVINNNEPLNETILFENITNEYLKASGVIADQSKDNDAVCDELGLDPFIFEEPINMLVKILESPLDEYDCCLQFDGEILRVIWFGEMTNLVERPNFLSDKVEPQALRAFFFGEENSYPVELLDNSSRDWRIRVTVLYHIIFSVQALANNLVGEHQKCASDVCSQIIELMQTYEEALSEVTQQAMVEELSLLPQSFSQACLSPRISIATKLQAMDAGIDLTSMHAEETMKALVEQLGHFISSKISRDVKVELAKYHEDEPNGYRCTATPDETSLNVISLLMARKKLPAELNILVGKCTTPPSILKSIDDPTQSIVIFEGVGLESITLKEQFIIHIGTAQC